MGKFQGAMKVAAQRAPVQSSGSFHTRIRDKLTFLAGIPMGKFQGAMRAATPRGS